MPFLVIACPSCGRARLLDDGPKTTQCQNCARRYAVTSGHVWGRFGSLHEARAALGRVNAARAGEPGAVEAYASLRDDIEAEPRDGIGRACAAARSVSGRVKRAELVAEGLTAEFGTWTGEDFREALDRLGIPAHAARDHLEKLLATGRVHEPAHGTYRAV